MQQPLTRTLAVSERLAQDGTLAASLASDEPYAREWGTEILDCRPESVDLSRAKDGLPLILHHDKTRLAGRIFGVYADGHRVRGSKVTFFDNEHGREARALALGGHREMSIGYAIEKSRAEPGGVLRATRWRLLEASIVAVPADVTVGLGRSTTFESTSTMEHDHVAAGNAGAAGEAGTQDHQLSRSQRRQLGQSDAAERERIRRITDTAAAFKDWVGAEQVAVAVREGYSAERFNEVIMDRMKSGTTDITTLVGVGGPAYVRNAGDPENYAQRYNIGRAVMAQIDPAAYMRAAGFEAEISRELQRSSPVQTDGLLVPYGAFFSPLRRDMLAGTSNLGGSTVATDIPAAEWIEALRARSVAIKMGARMLAGLDRPVTLPKKSATTTVGWLSEVSDAGETEPNTTGVALTPKRVGAYTEVSKQLMITSVVAVQNIVRDDLQESVLQELDRVAMLGTGSSNEPRGIKNTSGIGSVVGGANGATLIWQHLLDLEAAVDNANALVNPGMAGYAINGATRSYLKRTPKHATLSEGLIMGDKPNDADGFNQLNGYRAAVSGKLPSTLTKGSSGAVCSLLIFGDWSQLVIATFGPGVEIIIDPYTLAKSAQVRITANLFADVGLRHAAAFATMDDAKLS